MTGAIAAVVVTGAIVGTVAFSGSSRSVIEDVSRAGTFIANQPALLDSTTRQAFLNDSATAFDVHLVLHGPDGAVVATAGAGTCVRPIVVPVVPDIFGEAGGVASAAGPQLEICRPRGQGPPVRGIVAVGLVLAALSVVSSVLARRIGRPLANLADTAWRIGQGDLTARPDLGRRPPLEVAVVGEALSEMAARIERELQGQRALLAGASHELRTPLGHVRLQVELARARLAGDAGSAASVGAVLDDIDSEIEELDALLEKLLASARLDFRTLDRRPLVVADVARRALERAGLPDSLLVVDDDAGALRIDGDATLLSRGIGNLLENGGSHGGGVTSVRVSRVVAAGGGERVAVVVADRGPGVAAADRERIFEPFVHRADRGRAESAGSLGLGLHLVRRIAEAHGGRAAVGDTEAGEGGSRFLLELPTVS